MTRPVPLGLLLALWAVLLMGCVSMEREGVIALVGGGADPLPDVSELTLPLPQRPPGASELLLAFTPVAYGLEPGALDPLARRLGELLGLPVVPVSLGSYAQLIAAVEREEADLVMLAPLSYVIARQARPDLQPVAQTLVHGRTSYSSYLMVRQDSPARQLRDLVGGRVAFVDERSTSGFLLPYAAFLDHGVDPERDLSRVVFTGDHLLSLERLAGGQVDAAATYSAAVEQASGSAGGQTPLRMLHTAGRLPLDVICASGAFPAEGVARLRTALTSINTLHPAGRELYASTGRFVGWAPVDDQQYEPVRQVYQRVVAHRGEGSPAPVEPQQEAGHARD